MVGFVEISTSFYICLRARKQKATEDLTSPYCYLFDRAVPELNVINARMVHAYEAFSSSLLQ